MQRHAGPEPLPSTTGRTTLYSPFRRALSALLAVTLAAPPAVALGAQETAAPLEAEAAAAGGEPDGPSEAHPGLAASALPVHVAPRASAVTAALLASPGGSKSASTPQAIPLLGGSGSVGGTGETFTPELASGAATFAIPLGLAPGRAGVTPNLTLSYASTAGNGTLGIGWAIGTPFIARQSDRGLPHYVDRDVWHAEEDRFFFEGGHELVPVNAAAECARAGAR